jgi:hypothetical protein
MTDFFDSIDAKGRAALAEAVAEAGGDFELIDFEAARARLLASLTHEERIQFDAIEDAARRSGEGDRRTAEAVEFLPDLGAVGVPEPDPLH